MKYYLTFLSYPTSNELYHHGVKGQKWGVRRYQNYDGTRTAAGLKHERKTLRKQSYINAKNKYSKEAYEISDDELDANLKRLRKEKEYAALRKEIYGSKFLSQFEKIGSKVLIGGATVGATVFVQSTVTKLLKNSTSSLLGA